MTKQRIFMEMKSHIYPWDNDSIKLDPFKLSADEKRWLADEINMKITSGPKLSQKYGLSCSALYRYAKQYKNNIFVGVGRGRPRALDDNSVKRIIGEIENDHNMPDTQIAQMIREEYILTRTRRKEYKSILDVDVKMPLKTAKRYMKQFKNYRHGLL